MGAVAGTVLGLLLYVDNNFIGDPSEAAESLRTFNREGWINLGRTDTVDTELADVKDPVKRAELLEESGTYVESFGPAVFDHSRLDHAVFAGEEDTDRIDAVYAILFPGSDRRDSSTGRARRKLRDAMHIATAIRYGGTLFVTRDLEDLVSKSDAIAAAFNGFRIMTPERALAFVQRVKARHDHRQEHPLPAPGSDVAR
jgi:hypothetical protein